MDEEEELPTGFDVEAVTWFAEKVPDLARRCVDGARRRPLQLTYRIDDAAGRPMVVRRPQLGELLPAAHNIARGSTLIFGAVANAYARARTGGVHRRRRG